MSFLIPTLETFDSNSMIAEKGGLVKWLYPGADQQEQEAVIMSNNQEEESVKKTVEEEEQSSMQAKTSPSSTSAG